MQITTNLDSLYTLADRISAAPTFKLITPKKIRIDFSKYLPTNLYSIFRSHFEITLLCLNTLNDINLLKTLGNNITYTV